MSQNEIKYFLEMAKTFVSEASEHTRARFQSGFSTEIKSDASLVTEVDLEVEALLRDRITKTFPDHGIIGEEGLPHNAGASYSWVLDPIDGTQSFFHRVPTFGCIVALLRDGEPIVGIIDHPALNEQYYAAKGLGSFCNGTQIRIQDSSASSIDNNEIITLCSKKQWELTDQGSLFDSLWEKHSFYRIYYDCFALTRAIAGQTGAAIEMNVNLWDIAPCKVMIEEAGGRYVDLGVRRCANGKEGHSALFGKPSVTKILETWLKEN